MPNVQTIETYIQKSLNLIEAAPSEAKISITYGSNLKKHQKKKQSTKKEGSDDDIKTKSRKPLTKNFITFKTFEPKTGTCLKYKTYKLKEFSRLLSLLGPKSIQFNNSSVRSVGSLMSNSNSTNDDNNNNEDENNLAVTESSGLDTKETTPQPSVGKKNKKKKNKKR